MLRLHVTDKVKPRTPSELTLLTTAALHPYYIFARCSYSGAERALLRTHLLRSHLLRAYPLRASQLAQLIASSASVGHCRYTKAILPNDP